VQFQIYLAYRKRVLPVLSSDFPFFYPFKMPFSSAAVKMLPPHANAHAWLSSERNREKRTRLSQIANTFETEKKLGDFSDDLQPKRQNKKESELEFFTCYVVRLGWISLCSCGCWNKISRGLRFCHAVSGFEVGIFRKTMAMGNASSCKGGLIVCWPIENTRSLSIFCDKLFTHISRVLSAAAGYLRTVAWLQRMRCNCKYVSALNKMFIKKRYFGKWKIEVSFKKSWQTYF